MFGHLLAEAESDSISYCEVVLLVQNNSTILLLEKPVISGQSFYELPSGLIKQEESLQQVVQRVLMESVSLSLKRVVTFLTHRDYFKNDKKKRAFYFIIEANDLEDIALSNHHSFGWIEPKEAVGYPIREDLREILDLYIKLKSSFI